MTWLGRFFNLFRADSGMDRSPWGDFWFRPVGLLTRSGVRVTPANSMGVPAVLACTQVLANSFAILPPKLYRPKKNGPGRDQVRDHWLLRLLVRPNKWQTGYEWRAMLGAHLELRGNAYCHIQTNGRGQVLALVPLHPDRMTLEIMDWEAGSYRYAYRQQNGVTAYYTPGEIWHLRQLSDDGYTGMSRVSVAASVFGEAISMQDYSARFFANDAKPGGGWIEYPGQFATQDAKAKFRESWQQLQGGANRGKVAVLERGMKFHEMGVSNKDAQFIEARGLKGKEIAQIFRVPPHKIGILDNATFSNIEQQSIEFWQDTMMPICELWESSIEVALLGRFTGGPDDDLEIEFDMSRMMRGDAVSRAQRISQLVTAGVMTRNEAREEEGYDPMPGLDKPVLPVNVQVLDAQGNQPVEKLPAPGGDNAPPDDKASASRALMPPAMVRLHAVLRSNAARMAARLGNNRDVTPRALAEALGIEESAAVAWLEQPRGNDEQVIYTALLALGGIE